MKMNAFASMVTKDIFVIIVTLLAIALEQTMLFQKARLLKLLAKALNVPVIKHFKILPITNPHFILRHAKLRQLIFGTRTDPDGP